MADQNIKDFTKNKILLGLLVFSMLAFATGFIVYNNPLALGNANEVLNSTYSQVQSNLIEVPGSANDVSNVTAVTQSLDTSGSNAASAATSFGFMKTGIIFWESLILLLGYVFTGTLGQIIIGVLGGLIAFEAIYWIIQLGRVVL